MSKIVSATTIDAIIEELDTLSDEQYETRVDKFAEDQPVLIAYLFNEDNLHLLTEEEKGFLQYLSLIAYEAVERTLGKRERISEDEIGEAEEKNYEILESSTAKKFRDRLDPFFEGYKQEELLAFAEEAVMEDEEDPESVVTKEGREPIFITVKTLIDVLTAE